MTLHTARLLCDGHRWSAGGWIRIEDGRVRDWGTGGPPTGTERTGRTGRTGRTEPVVRHGTLLPGLVDGHARVTGYFNQMIRGDALAPHRACLTLAAEAGVTTVLSVGGHTEPLAALAAQAAPGDPALLWTGPLLDGPPVATTATRLVQDARSAHHAVAALAADGARWVGTGPSLSPSLLGEVVAAAAGHGMRVTHQPGRTGAAEAAKAGVHRVQDLPRCLLESSTGGAATGATTGAAALIRSFADPRARRTGAERLRVLAGQGTALVPLLHSWRRSALLDEAVSEPRLERLLPMAPFHQYLLDMRGPGMVFGRRYAREHFGYEHLKGAARKEFDEGWAALLESLATAHDLGVPLVPGSDALGLSLVPGHALYDELAWWERAGLPRHTVLTAATGGAFAELTGTDPAGAEPQPQSASPWPTGVLALPGVPDELPSVAALPSGCRVLAPAHPRFGDRLGDRLADPLRRTRTQETSP